VHKGFGAQDLGAQGIDAQGLGVIHRSWSQRNESHKDFVDQDPDKDQVAFIRSCINNSCEESDCIL